MDRKIRAYRKDVLKLSQEGFARLLGLRSKGHICDIERTDRCAPSVALEIEKISKGAINAAEISPAVARIRERAA